MSVNRGFVIEQPLFLGPVRDSHDIDITKLGTGFAPLTLGQNLVSADL